MTVDKRAVVRVCQKDALILTCKGKEEVLNEMNLFISKLDTALVETHVINCIFESLAGTIVVVRPCVLDVAEARNLEAMTVTFELSLLEATIILNCEFLSPVSEVMSAESHELVRLTAEVMSDVACRAVISLEEFISSKFLSGNSLIVTKEPLVEA